VYGGGGGGEEEAARRWRYNWRRVRAAARFDALRVESPGIAPNEKLCRPAQPPCSSGPRSEAQRVPIPDDEIRKN